MLCLCGFELYPRWVPLLIKYCQKRKTKEKRRGNGSFTLFLTTNCLYIHDNQSDGQSTKTERKLSIREK